MTSTVTTSTVTILTLSPAASSLALIAVLVLLALLISKELSVEAFDRHWQSLGLALNIALLPLLITFALIVLFRVIEVLQ